MQRLIYRTDLPYRKEYSAIRYPREPVPLVAELTGMPGTGDVWTTVGDLVRYVGGIRDGELLSGPSWQLMGCPHATIDDTGDAAAVSVSAYGYGTDMGTIAGSPARFHSGDNPGFRSLLAWLLRTNVAFAVLSNDESVVLEDISLRLARATEE